MKNSNAFGVSVADVAFNAGSLRAGRAYFAAAHPAPASAHAGTPAHAATATAAITPMRKRRIATATDASVNRGST
jgi:poly-gamma-glutamate capsule biosynthesis protein CapA/YwtB (metallophosphatase superfamily)